MIRLGWMNMKVFDKHGMDLIVKPKLIGRLAGIWYEKNNEFRDEGHELCDESFPDRPDRVGLLQGNHIAPVRLTRSPSLGPYRICLFPKT